MNPKSSGNDSDDELWVIEEIKKAKVIPNSKKPKLKEFNLIEYSKQVETPFKKALKHSEMPYTAKNRLKEFDLEENLVSKRSGYKFKRRITLQKEEQIKEVPSSINKGVEKKEEAIIKNEVFSFVDKKDPRREENKINREADDFASFLTPESLDSKDKSLIKKTLLAFCTESSIADAILEACETLREALLNAGININQNSLVSDDDYERAIAESLKDMQPDPIYKSEEKVEIKRSQEFNKVEVKEKEKKIVEKNIVEKSIIEDKVLEEKKVPPIIEPEQNKPKESPPPDPPADQNRKANNSRYSEYMTKYQIVDGGSEAFSDFYYAENESLTESQVKAMKAGFPRLINLLGCDSPMAYYFLLSTENLRKIKCLITGNSSTPYAHGLYVFDCVVKNQPPSVLHLKLKTGLSNNLNFSPVIKGMDTNPLTLENLNIGISIYNLAATFMDNKIIQKEPGNESVAEDHPLNVMYQFEVKYMNLKFAILDYMRNPPIGFEETSKYHFKFKEQEILQTAKIWTEEAKSYVLDNRLSSQNTSIKNTFEMGVGKAFEELYKALVKEFNPKS